jgi:hypothetical protein
MFIYVSQFKRMVKLMSIKATTLKIMDMSKLKIIDKIIKLLLTDADILNLVRQHPHKFWMLAHINQFFI